MAQKSNLLLVDANSLIHRAYHSYPLSLVNAKGEPINAVFGFTSMLLDILNRYKPKYVICAFDSKAPTFRHKEYTGYKAHRPKTDMDLSNQFAYAKQVVNSLNIPLFEMEGFEADDIIGTIVDYSQKELLPKNKIKEVTILANDKDLFQLLTHKNIKILAPYKHFKVLQTIDKDQIKEILGITPEQVIDYKALVGDPSDNIPGIKGIGPKTAIKLLNEYKTLKNIYANINSIKKQNPTLGRKLEDGYQDAMLSYQLATIKKDVPIILELDKALLKDFDINKAINTFLQMQFKSLVPRLTKLYTEITGKEPDLSQQPQESTKIEQLVSLLKQQELTPQNILNTLKQLAKDPKQIAVFTQDTIYTGKLKQPKKILQLSKCKKTNMLLDLVTKLQKQQVPITYGLFNALEILIQDNQNNILEILDLFKNGVFDTQLASYALMTARRSYTLEDLASLYLNTNTNNKDIANLVANIAKKQSKQLIEICTKHQKPTTALVSLIDPFVSLAVWIMHKNGICLNQQAVQEYNQELLDKLSQLEYQIHQSVGFEFNVRSTKQLADVLYNVLHLPTGKKRKTGYSTDVNTLLQLMGTHPVIPLLLEYRKLQKIHSTYIKPFLNGKYVKQPPTIDKSKQETQQTILNLLEPNKKQTLQEPIEECAKIHSIFNPLRTSTGRLASSNPNLQNLPIRTEEGAKIRTFFVPSPGYKFIAFDYSQIDLRVLAHTSKDQHLIQAFRDNRDIHKETASKIFKKPYDSITKQERRVAKTINFGIVYGMSAYGLARSLDISMKEAKEFLETYFAEFPKVKEYMHFIENFVLENGYVLSLLGRRRYIAGITSNNPNIRQSAFREAINMPIQGGSDDILRKAIRDLYINIKDLANNQIRLVLQIHDELVFEVPDNQKTIKTFVNQATQIMENTLEYPKEFSVPLKVGVEVKETL